MAVGGRVLSAVAVAFLVCFSSYVAKGQSQIESEPKRLTKLMHVNRASIRYGEFEWVVRIVTYRAHPVLEGARYEYHGWYDFSSSKERIRVDAEKNVPSNALITYRSRFAFADGVYRIVDAEDLLGRELVGYGYDYMKQPESLRVFDVSADPRLIGLLPTEFVLLKNRTLDDLLALLESSRESTVSTEVDAGRQLTKVTYVGYLGADCNVSYWLDETKGLMPGRIVSKANTGSEQIVIDINTKWKAFEDESGMDAPVWMPEEVDSRRWVDGVLEIHEQVAISRAVIGIKPDGTLFTWESMNLPDGFVVKRLDGISTEMKQWNVGTQSFGKWAARPLGGRESGGSGNRDRGGFRLSLVILNAIGAVLFLGFALRRWIRR